MSLGIHTCLLVIDSMVCIDNVFITIEIWINDIFILIRCSQQVSKLLYEMP